MATKTTCKNHNLPDTLGALFVYGAIGLVGTLAHFITLMLLVELFSIPVVLSSSVGFILGALINHELNRIVLFADTTRSRTESGIRFLSTAAIGFCINVALMTALVLAGAHYILAQLIATGIVFLVTFFINRRWTFGL